MTISIEHVSNHLFVGGFWGFLYHSYFFCCVKKCPFSLAMEVGEVSGKRVATACHAAVFRIHFRLKTDKHKAQIRKEISEQLKFIQENPTHPKSAQLKRQHAAWNREARRSSKSKRKRLLDIEALKDYAILHPEKSAKQLNEACGLSLNPRSFCNIVLGEKEKRGIAVDLNNIISKGQRHFLGNGDKDIVVFGLRSSIHLLSNTSLIQGDGTFTCGVHPFTQLYIFMLSRRTAFPTLSSIVSSEAKTKKCTNGC